MKRRLNSKTVRFRFSDPEFISAFNSLPNEVLLEIFNFLPGPELRKCCCTCKKWRDLVSTLFDTEVVIICDTTMSMASTWKMLVPQIDKLVKQKDKIRFGFVGYADHYESNKVVTSLPLTYLSDKLISGIKQIPLGVGHDEPEAVLDGLYAALQLDWKPNSHKACILICDSPPHGRRYWTTSQDEIYLDDDYPDGCPCGLSETFILSHFKDMSFFMLVLYTSPSVEKMCSLFKEQVPNMMSIEIKSNDLGDMLETISKVL